MTGAASITCLRNIAARLIEQGDPDGEWFMAALQEYVAGAPVKLTLDQALGLRPRRGETPWWEAETRDRRDELIRSTAKKWYPGRSYRALAEIFFRDLQRYEAGSWRQHRALRSPPETLAGTVRAELFWLLKVGSKITERIIRDVLAGEMPVLTGHEAGDASPTATEALTDGRDQIQKSA